MRASMQTCTLCRLRRTTGTNQHPPYPLTHTILAQTDICMGSTSYVCSDAYLSDGLLRYYAWTSLGSPPADPFYSVCDVHMAIPFPPTCFHFFLAFFLDGGLFSPPPSLALPQDYAHARFWPASSYPADPSEFSLVSFPYPLPSRTYRFAHARCTIAHLALFLLPGPATTARTSPR